VKPVELSGTKEGISERRKKLMTLKQEIGPEIPDN
jgi:hypothetical protein